MKALVSRTVLTAIALAAFTLAEDDSAIKQRIQFEEDVYRFNQINVAMHESGRKPSPEDEEFVKKFNASRNRMTAEFKQTNTPKESVGITALNDLGSGMYKGEQGGLYPQGKNTPPAAHLKAGIAIAKSIQPLNAAGQPDPQGKIVLTSIGYSNWTLEWVVFVNHAMKDPERNPKVQVLDCAMSAQSNEMMAHSEAEYYKVVDKRLSQAGVTPAQVQIVMLKVATWQPWLPFPWEAKNLQSMEVSAVHVLRERFPNLKLLYVTSRMYGGYADIPLNPEPHALETGLAVKWLIGDQIAGKPELNFDAKKGPVRAPWMAWGPYLWADGVKGREDGLKWFRDDLRANDHTHPSQQGCEKVSKLLTDFLKNDPTTKVWYVRQAE